MFGINMLYLCVPCPHTNLCFCTRVKKLRETLVAVQQLDKNMSSLRSWLSHIETELSRPIVYETCNDQEIQRKLNQQQACNRTQKLSQPSIHSMLQDHITQIIAVKNDSHSST